MNKKVSLLISFGIIVLLIGIDQLTKWLCNTNEVLLSGDRIMIIKNFVSLRLAYNKGAAWSILEGKKFLLVSISLLAIALILIDAGSIGNLIDRAFYSEGVIDFIHLEFIDFPTFNVADSCLTVGAIVLMVYVLFLYKEPNKKVPLNEEVGEEENA